MNSCKQCGKEIPEGRKFCNSSCAAKYNNVHRTRKPWTEEQKQRVARKRQKVQKEKGYGTKVKEKVLAEVKEQRQFDVEQKCKYCGKGTGKYATIDLKWRKPCEECRPYVQRVITYTKAGLCNGSLKERDLELHKRIRELHEAGHCITEICKELGGIHDVTVRTILKEEGLHLYSLSEVQLRMYAENFRDVSPRHGGMYRSGFHITWEGKKVWLRSSYEFDYAKQLDEQKVRYEVESKRIRYYDTVENRNRVAVPDFFLPDTNELVEVKSTWTLKVQEMKDKFKAYRDSGYKPILFLNKKVAEDW